MKGVAGVYQVHFPQKGVYECKPKGIFRKDKQKPLVGDNVKIEVLKEEEKTGLIVELLPRKECPFHPYSPRSSCCLDSVNHGYCCS